MLITDKREAWEWAKKNDPELAVLLKSHGNSVFKKNAEFISMTKKPSYNNEISAREEKTRKASGKTPRIKYQKPFISYASRGIV